MNWIGNASRTGLVQIPIILLLCIGILAFSAWRRHPGWWLMVAGNLLLLLGYVSQAMLLQVDAASTLASVMIGLVHLRECGLLLFALGFASIGAVVVRLHRRNLELEPTGGTTKPGKGGRKP